MQLNFELRYRTLPGQRLYVYGNLAELGSWNPDHAIAMNWHSGDNWEVFVDIPQGTSTLQYKYFVQNESGGQGIIEWGDPHTKVFLEEEHALIECRDQWKEHVPAFKAWTSKAFTDIIQRRHSPPTLQNPESFNLFFEVYAPLVPASYKLCLIGGDGLGNWDEKKALIMDDAHFPRWTLSMTLDKVNRLEYKYAIYDVQKECILQWEDGENRVLNHFPNPEMQKLTWVSDYLFRGSHTWRGTGVALPIFSLRSRNGMGVGEFLDLKPFTDWAKKAGLKLVQVLPINDTTAHHSWLDSYPYSAISVYALHPIYANLDAICTYYNMTLSDKYARLKTELNRLDVVDYDQVMEAKSEFFSDIYKAVKYQSLVDPAFIAYFEANQEWLRPYAAFCYLRDQNGTADYNTWKNHSIYNQEAIDALTAPDYSEFDEIALHYFIQFHLHVQLSEAKAYASKQGIVLKGDLPIGIYRYSVDAWMAPHLYNMNGQAGAPPDAFATEGQNWGFPTYNWEVMAQDGYAWWRQRLTHLSHYFDAYRIDHILGFFRIWEIPYEMKQGLLGCFNPSLPFTTEELLQRGVKIDRERMCNPYIRRHILETLFGELAGWVVEHFLEENENGSYFLKPDFQSQRAVETYLNEKSEFSEAQRNTLETGLFKLIGERIFLDTGMGSYHPRVGLQHTYSFRELSDEALKARINVLYDEYFYKRHEAYWKDQAMEKLPAIIGASSMMVCGEDLGMVPASVPGVMNELGIMSLEIQRMPKQTGKEFDHPSNAPYMSVCSTSTHDMPPIRSWWEKSTGTIARFYRTILGFDGQAPYFCEPWIAEAILRQHLHSPAMWAIFPIQDLLAIEGDLRRENPHAEQINDPSNPENYWQYRVHLSVEELLQVEEFNDHLLRLVKEAGRM